MTQKLFLYLVTLALGISSCSGVVSAGGSELNAWFDAPLPGTVYHQNDPCQIVAHGASPNGIAEFGLAINGQAILIPSPDTKSSLVTLTQDCGLTEPGNYLLELRARDNDGKWSGFAETNLVILGEEVPPAIETTTPVIIPTIELNGDVSVESISTNLVYLGKASCGPVDVTITAHVIAPKGIKVVVLFYRFATDGASNEFQSASMNSIGGDLYRQTLNPTSLLGGTIPFDQAILQYQIVIQQNDGDTSLRTPVLTDITVQACGDITPPDCSSYTDQGTCTANGCNWVNIPAAIPLFACQRP
jgi:hypothetical protein